MKTAAQQEAGSDLVLPLQALRRAIGGPGFFLPGVQVTGMIHNARAPAGASAGFAAG